MKLELTIHRMSLDVHQIQSQTCLPVRRWDTGHSLLVCLTEDGEPYTIGEDCVTELVCQKPDGTLLKNYGTVENGQIRCDLTRRVTSQAGEVSCEIRLYNAVGVLLTSPRFRIQVYAAIYDYGDAVESEIVSANTVKSANPGYAEVYMWSDGNPDGEDRLGRFVAADESRSPAMVTLCDGSSRVWGVTMTGPGFAANASGERYDDSGALQKRYCYVGLLGLVPVADQGQCTVGGRCRPGTGGNAVPSDTGFLVTERLDEDYVLILLERGADDLGALEEQLEAGLEQVRQVFTANLTAAWTGSAAPYTQEVVLSGLLQTDTPHVTPVYDSNVQTALEQMQAWSQVSRAKAEAGKLTFYCLEEKPAVAIPISVEVIR